MSFQPQFVYFDQKWMICPPSEHWCRCFSLSLVILVLFHSIIAKYWLNVWQMWWGLCLICSLWFWNKNSQFFSVLLVIWVRTQKLPVFIIIPSHSFIFDSYSPCWRIISSNHVCQSFPPIYSFHTWYTMSIHIKHAWEIMSFLSKSPNCIVCNITFQTLPQKF